MHNGGSDVLFLAFPGLHDHGVIGRYHIILYLTPMSLLKVLLIIALSGVQGIPGTVRQHASFKPVPDTAKKFVVDDFPVSDGMFGRDVKGNAREIRSGEIRSMDKVWFTNDSLHQTLVYELYTDNFRMDIFLFSNDKIPKGLISSMELHTPEGHLATDRQKQKFFSGFIPHARKIKPRYFVSDKGIKIGTEKQAILKLYGKPNESSRTGEIEMLGWDFIGDILYDGKTSLKGHPLAKDSFGHHATMFFQDDKLIGMNLHNDIP